MAAIWGIVNLNNEQPSMIEFQKMKDAFQKYKIDRYDIMESEHAIFGCAHQHFTKEAERDILPVCENRRIFTADVMIDNMDEIAPRLNSQGIPLSLGTDSEILRQVVWNNAQDIFHDLYGIFSFADYDTDSNTLILGTDALGIRILYYCKKGNNVYFSTIMESIVSVCHNNWNYNWIGGFIAQNNLGMHYNNTDTIYEDIFLVPAAHTLTFTLEETVPNRYWFPFKEHPIRKITDEQCKQQLIDIFSKAVKCVLRAPGETGMFLSGGLDSTAVACFAAPELKKRNQKLHTFTAIPEDTYTSKYRRYFVPNEMEQVHETAEFLGNLVEHTLPLNGINSWDFAPELLNIYEQPYKSTLNCIWLLEGQKKAYEQGIRIMLNGQYGNASISYGNYYTYLYTLLHQGKVIKFIKETNALQRKQNTSRKRICKALLKDTVSPYKTDWNAYYDIFSDDFCQKYQIKENWKTFYDAKSKGIKLYKNTRKLLINEAAIRHVAESQVKLSLATNVLVRDPTKDRRLIEFIISLPMEQFCQDGIERRLIYAHLSEFMPAEVLHFTMSHKGLQSADLKNRLAPHWNRIHDELSTLYTGESAKLILSHDKVNRLLDSFKKSPDEHSDFELQRFLYVGLLLSILEQKY